MSDKKKPLQKDSRSSISSMTTRRSAIRCRLLLRSVGLEHAVYSSAAEFFEAL